MKVGVSPGSLRLRPVDMTSATARVSSVEAVVRPAASVKGTCSPENPIFHGKNHGFLFNKVVKPFFLVKIVPTKPIHRVQSGTGSGSWQCDMVGNMVR